MTLLSTIGGIIMNLIRSEISKGRQGKEKEVGGKILALDNTRRHAC